MSLSRAGGGYDSRCQCLGAGDRQVELSMSLAASLSVLIPTYQRERVLIDTLGALFNLKLKPTEVIVIDQTEVHEASTLDALTNWDKEGRIRWLRLSNASIPGAMNHGLLAATGDIVLFLDDDIIPDRELFAAHLAAHSSAGLVAGLVLQPGETAHPQKSRGHFRFNSSEPAWINEFMGGNFSVDREIALALGGFDENFVGAAFRFEAEFAHRYCERYGEVLFAPSAGIRHLQASSGGTRAHGSHLRTVKPAHSVGEYYYLLSVRPKGWKTRFLLRPLRSIRTRHHLSRPWWIPLSLFAELKGMILAAWLRMRGPHYVHHKA